MFLLNKVLYDLKQSARQFYLFLAKLFKDLDLKSIIADQSVFYNDKTKIIVTAHIDNLLIFAFNKKKMNFFKKQLDIKVDLSDLDDASYFLDIKIVRDRNKQQLFLSQNKYIKKLLIKFNIKEEKTIYTSDIQDIKLEKYIEQASTKDIKSYQQQVESLIYLITVTRSDLAFSVDNCVRFISNLSADHFKAFSLTVC